MSNQQSLPGEVASITQVLTHHAHAKCWKVTLLKRPNRVIRLTDHPRPLKIFDGFSYEPASGYEATARRKTVDLQAHSVDPRGIITSTQVTEQDLRSKLLEGSSVVEYLVDHRWPWKTPLEEVHYKVRGVDFDNHEYSVMLDGVAQALERGYGDLWGLECRVPLFSQGFGRCNADPLLHTQRAKNVVSVVQVRLEFTVNVAGGVWDADGYANEGNVLWLNGPNEGLSAEIKTHTAPSTFTANLVLQQPMPYDITNTDTVTVSPGCNHQPGITSTVGDCKNKYSNLVNFQGEPFIPGSDKVQRGVDR